MANKQLTGDGQMAALTPQDDSKISISLYHDLFTGEWFVTRLDITYGQVTNTTRFKSAAPVQSAFCAAFIDQLGRFLPRRGETASVTRADAVVALGNLVLKGIRVMAARDMDGFQTVVVRFSQAHGALMSLLAPVNRPDAAPAPHGASFANGNAAGQAAVSSHQFSQAANAAAGIGFPNR